MATWFCACGHRDEEHYEPILIEVDTDVAYETYPCNVPKCFCQDYQEEDVR